MIKASLFYRLAFFVIAKLMTIKPLFQFNILGNLLMKNYDK